MGNGMLSASEIFGRPAAPAVPEPWTATLETAGLLALGATSTAEDVEAALRRVRQSLHADLDELSRESLRRLIRDRLHAQGAPHTVGMIDAALAPAPETTNDRENRPRRSPATQLVDLILAAGVELWHCPAGDAHITLPVADHREHHRLASGAVRDWLGRRYHAEMRGTPGSQAIADALTVLSGKARYDGAEHATAVRVGGDGRHEVYLDLGDATWRAIRVTAAGWQIVTDPPVRLVRSRGMRPLPEPIRGGSIEAIRALVHVATDDDYRLLVGWQVGALCPRGPYPLLALAGEQGTGKSTAARIIRRLIDPHVAELRAEPRTIDDIMIAARWSRVVALDNLSYLTPWLSDALCRLSTGGALTRRELYSDADEVIIEAIRPTIITAISDIVTRGDLLDRVIAVTLPVLPESDRLAEAELWRRFDAAAPGILGGLCDAVASALMQQAAVSLPELPRMADWVIWCTAAEPALGWPSGSVVSAYRAMRGAAVEATLDGDPLAVALRAVSRPWTGTAADLLARLRPVDARFSRSWPESPRALSSALRRLAPGLRRVGVEIETRREAHTGRRLITIVTSTDAPDGASPSSPTSPRPILRPDAGDDGDDGDAVFPVSLRGQDHDAERL